MFNVQTIVASRAEGEDILKALIGKNLASAGFIHEVEAIYYWDGSVKTEMQYAVGINCSDGQAVKEYIENHAEFLVPSIFVTEVENSMSCEIFNNMLTGALLKKETNE